MLGYIGDEIKNKLSSNSIEDAGYRRASVGKRVAGPVLYSSTFISDCVNVSSASSGVFISVLASEGTGDVNAQAGGAWLNNSAPPTKTGLDSVVLEKRRYEEEEEQRRRDEERRKTFWTKSQHYFLMEDLRWKVNVHEKQIDANSRTTRLTLREPSKRGVANKLRVSANFEIETGVEPEYTKVYTGTDGK